MPPTRCQYPGLPEDIGLDIGLSRLEDKSEDTLIVTCIDGICLAHIPYFSTYTGVQYIYSSSVHIQ